MDIVSEVIEQEKTTEQQVGQPLKPIYKPKKNRFLFYVLIVMVFVGVFLIILWRNGFSSTSIDTSVTKFSQYKTQRFSVSYPADWAIRESQTLGGSGFAVMPKSEVREPSVYVVEFDTLEDLELTERINSEYNYKKNTIMLRDGEATVWSGSRKATMSGWQIQERIVILVRPDRFYKLILMYPAEKPNEQYEKIFSEIISTFKLQG